MRWIRLGAILLAAFALSPLWRTAAHADPYKWCAHLSGRDGEFANDCYYHTYQQCMDTVSGIGGRCEPNPFYDGRPVVDEYSRPQGAARPRRSH